MPLHAEALAAFAHISFHTQLVFSQRYFYAEALLHACVFTQNVFTLSGIFFTHRISRTGAFADKNIDTQRSNYTQGPLQPLPLAAHFSGDEPWIQRVGEQLLPGYVGVLGFRALVPNIQWIMTLRFPEMGVPQ